jgi:hypothetical protein
MYYPLFAYGCSLEINSQRTAAYLDSATTTCDAGDLKSRIDLTCDCDPLHWKQNDETGVWSPAVYTNPVTDQAPWYDADIPESAQFLGFMIEDVKQDTAVSGRTFSTRLSSSGGGTIGPVRNKERRLDFTVLMFACNEPAMEYGFRFLNDMLMSPGCDDGCTLCDAEYRESCPAVDGSAESLDQGRWILKNVGAVIGPVWGDNPLSGSACNIRRVQFTLVSELPWKFKCPVPVCTDVALAGYPADGVDCVNWSDILCGKQEVSCTASEPLIIGETGLIIEVQAGDIDLQHIEIAVRPDPYGYEANEGTRPAGYVRTEPCDLIYLPAIPANSRLVYDTSIEEIKVVLPGGGEVDGTIYVATDEGNPPSFPTLRCGDFCISVSVSECSVVGTPTVSISSVHREL